MVNNRDSSVLRSLAVAFGDGLAFGVGMKLTRGSSQPVAPRIALAPEAAPAAVDLTPLLDRLQSIEKRIGQVEKAPVPVAAAPAAPAATAAAPPFDQKVIGAIVHALDARLAEQAEQVERRLTELEGKLAAELTSLAKQDHSIVTGVQGHIEEVNAQLTNELAGVRRRQDDERAAQQQQLGALQQALTETAQAMESRLAQLRLEDLNAQFQDQLAAIRRRSDEEREAMQREMGAMQREFSLEAAAAMESRLAEMRAEIAARDGVISDLRLRLEHGDESLRNVVAAIAQACQTVVGKPGERKKIEAESAPEKAPEAPPANPAPLRPGPRMLALPLVSSLAVASAVGMAMIHYL